MTGLNYKPAYERGRELLIAETKRTSELSAEVERLTKRVDQEYEAGQSALRAKAAIHRAEVERLTQERDQWEQRCDTAYERFDAEVEKRAAAEGQVRQLREALETVLTKCEDANQAWQRLAVAAVARKALAATAPKETP